MKCRKFFLMYLLVIKNKLLNSTILNREKTEYFERKRNVLEILYFCLSQNKLDKNLLHV